MPRTTLLQQLKQRVTALSLIHRQRVTQVGCCTSESPCRGITSQSAELDVGSARQNGVGISPPTRSTERFTTGRSPSNRPEATLLAQSEVPADGTRPFRTEHPIYLLCHARTLARLMRGPPTPTSKPFCRYRQARTNNRQVRPNPPQCWRVNMPLISFGRISASRRTHDAK
jgi:hypothetical protein